MSGRWTRAVVMGSVVLLIGALTVTLGGLFSGGDEGASPATSLNEPVDSTQTTAADTTMASPTTATTIVEPRRSDTDAPWSGARLAAGEVPAILVTEWQNADNRSWCSGLAPAATVEGAAPRAAEFGGGWAVAWDLPDHRSAFGVAGVGMPQWSDIGVRVQDHVVFPDGSVVGWYPEGFDPGSERNLAEIGVPGEGCAYQVWSELGVEHLVELVWSLRRVTELEADPVKLRRGTVEVIERGASPWSGHLVPVSEIDPAVVAAWRAAGGDAPLLAFTDLGFDDGLARTAVAATWAIAWDRPEGPGHDALNTPCADCGRGVVGLGAWQGESAMGSEAPTIVTWSDGSRAEIGYRVGWPEIPPDRPQFRDAQTGEPLVDGLEAHIVIPGVEATYLVWSHLGMDALLDLIDGMRFVDQ